MHYASSLIALSALHFLACGDSGSSGVGGNGGTTPLGGSEGQGGESAAVGGMGGTGGAACVSGLEQDTPECTACQDANCCLSATAAAEDPGTWTNSAAKICTDASCYAECGVPQPECGGIVPSPASCKDALYEACCAEVTACAESDECVAMIYLCVDDQGCDPSKACWDDCLAMYGAGEQLFDDLLDCFGPVDCG